MVWWSRPETDVSGESNTTLKKSNSMSADAVSIYFIRSAGLPTTVES